MADDNNIREAQADYLMRHPECLRRTVGELIRDLERLPKLNRAMQRLLDDLRAAVRHYDSTQP